ncbi:MAG: crotonase/enoyl-CoA hydratase family protein [Pseudomonadota bacterium]
MTDHIKITEEDGIRIVRIDRVEKKNALTQDMYQAMAEALETMGDSDLGAIVFFGAPEIFTAGNDISDFMARAMTTDLTTSPTIRFLKALVTCEKPMLAGVDGKAIGVGTTMLMHCDLVYASDRASLKTPFLTLGLVPEAGSSLLAPKIMGHHRAFELLVLGETFSAERAREAGLVNQVVEDSELEAATLAAAQKLASLPPEALNLSRGLLRSNSEDIIARIEEESRLFAMRLKSDEAREAFMAFMEKRPPSFVKKAS